MKGSKHQSFEWHRHTNRYPPSIHDKEEGAMSVPSTLPPAPISEPAKKLLTHLLTVNPTHRLKTLRQLQQSAFYMNFNMDDVRSMKVSPKALLDQHYPDGLSRDTTDNYNEELRAASQQVFSSFDQFTIV